MLKKCLVFAGINFWMLVCLHPMFIPSQHETLVQRWFTVGPTFMSVYNRRVKELWSRHRHSDVLSVNKTDCSHYFPIRWSAAPEVRVRMSEMLSPAKYEYSAEIDEVYSTVITANREEYMLRGANQHEA